MQGPVVEEGERNVNLLVFNIVTPLTLSFSRSSMAEDTTWADVL